MMQIDGHDDSDDGQDGDMMDRMLEHDEQNEA